jgi:alkylation response protein AidB-like acyl-CoA dehydrogenase
MDFDLTEDQKEIKRVARELLAARSPFAAVRAAAEAATYDAALWAELRELGWAGIAVGEEYGGQGLGAVALAVLLEEHGYACASTPLVSSAVVAAVIDAEGTAEQRAQWLPGLVSGELSAALGTRGIAADAPGADVALIVDGSDAWLIGAAEAEPFVAIDLTRRFGAVHGEGEPLGPLAAARVRGALSAELVGVAQRALDMTVEYVKERKQFGVPVGSFQAVSHRCAQMLLGTESARSMAYHAAWAADASTETLDEAAALAAAAACDAGVEVSASAIQAHGGIGFTWEADVHWLYKRAQADAALIGGGKLQRSGLAELVRRRAARSAVP